MLSSPPCASSSPWLLVTLASCTPHEAGEPLPRLNILPGSLTVSGVSAGGYMATQYQVAFSKDVIGAGISRRRPLASARRASSRGHSANAREGSAGGPDDDTLGCDAARERRGPCRRRSVLARDRPRLDLPRQARPQDRRRGLRLLASLLSRDFVPRERIRYETQVPAAHGFPTKDSGAACDCRTHRHGSSTAISTLRAKCCAYLYDDLREPAGRSQGELRRLRPGAATSRRANPFHRCTATGLLFVPRDCAGGQALPDPRRLSWLSSRASAIIGRPLRATAGYNRWADDNRIVVLYPQAATESGRWPFNPRGCWDWWGYSGADYAARTARSSRA